MKNLHAKRFALAIFAVFAVFFVALALVGGTPFAQGREALLSAYKTIPLVLLVVGWFVNYGWRWRVFRGWLVPFPDLDGTWHGSIHTTWRDPATGAVPAGIPVILTIRQSFTRISCVMRTGEMTSRSYLADFWLDGDEQVRMLGYSYHSKPLPFAAHRSQQHDGTIVFELVGSPVARLKGTYWNTRGGRGEVVLTFREKQRLDEFPNDLGTHSVSGQVSSQKPIEPRIST